jgi:hypothetical protein
MYVLCRHASMYVRVHECIKHEQQAGPTETMGSILGRDSIFYFPPPKEPERLCCST